MTAAYPLFATLAAYLLGSLSFAVIVTRVMGLSDPRTYGSKNPGATNVLRSGSKVAAIVTLLLDAVKGWVPVVLVRWFGKPYGLEDGTIGSAGQVSPGGHDTRINDPAFSDQHNDVKDGRALAFGEDGIAGDVRAIVGRAGDLEGGRRAVGEVDGGAGSGEVNRRQAPAAEDAIGEGVGAGAPAAALAVGAIPEHGGGVIEGLVVTAEALFLIEGAVVDAAVVAVAGFEVTAGVIDGLGPGEGVEDVEATGEAALSPGFLAWRTMCAQNPEFDVARLFARGNRHMSAEECAAYNAPFPDRGHRAALRAFPPLVPEHAQDDGAAISRQARDFWATRWEGQSLMAIGQQDPVLGEPVMRNLHRHIRHCPPPMLLPQAGHFVQEHGQSVAQAAVSHFAVAPRG